MGRNPAPALKEVPGIVVLALRCQCYGMEPDLFQQWPPYCTCDGLTLVGRVPRVGAMRELFTYRCEACGHVETLEALPNERRTI